MHKTELEGGYKCFSSILFGRLMAALNKVECIFNPGKERIANLTSVKNGFNLRSDLTDNRYAAALLPLELLGMKY